MMNIWSLKTVRDRCEEVGECWIWQQHQGKGYPKATIGGKTGLLVRRWVWEHVNGDFPPGKWHVISTCQDRLCCNPAHLKLTKPRNTCKRYWASGHRNMLSHARAARASIIAAGRTKLDFDKARAIREDKRPAAEVAVEYGVSKDMIYRIRQRKAWADVPISMSSVFALAASCAAA